MNKEELKAKAANIRARAKEYNLTITAHDGVVSVYGNFPVGDQITFRAMENNAWNILSMFRQTRAGSVWGTDSGSVGGAIGLEKGYVRMNKSGVDKRLSKMFEAEEKA